jgi:hypothetical protein
MCYPRNAFGQWSILSTWIVGRKPFLRSCAWLKASAQFAKTFLTFLQKRSKNCIQQPLSTITPSMPSAMMSHSPCALLWRVRLSQSRSRHSTNTVRATRVEAIRLTAPQEKLVREEWIQHFTFTTPSRANTGWSISVVDAHRFISKRTKFRPITAFSLFTASRNSRVKIRAGLAHRASVDHIWAKKQDARCRTNWIR